MRYVKWSLIALVLLFFGLLFHYTLPQRDIVRIVGTYEERQDFDWKSRPFYSDAGGLANKDVLFIQTLNAKGRTRVYRNEDTGIGWPFYFKFDTANLQTEAQDAVSTAAAPEWYAVTHYGWRNTFLSIFPNAVKIKPVEGPEVRLIPWFNIVFFFLLTALILWLRSRWIRFREDRIDPALDDLGDASDAARGRVRRLFDRLRGRG